MIKYKVGDMVAYSGDDGREYVRVAGLLGFMACEGYSEPLYWLKGASGSFVAAERWLEAV